VNHELLLAYAPQSLVRGPALVVRADTAGFSDTAAPDIAVRISRTTRPSWKIS
jgi:hypothetical protein